MRAVLAALVAHVEVLTALLDGSGTGAALSPREQAYLGAERRRVRREILDIRTVEARDLTKRNTP